MSERARAVISDFAERAGWSAAQQFFAVLLTGSTAATVGALPWKLALVTAAGAALASALATALQYVGKLTDLPFWPDLLVRVLKTFLASLVASLAAGGLNVTTFHWTAALNVAAVAAITALGKGLLAREPEPAPTAAPAGSEGLAGAAPGGMAAGGPSPSTLPSRTYRLACRPAA